MKRLILFSVALCWVAGIAQSSSKIILPVEQLYTIEQGFDTNDGIEIALWGYLPDTCHKLGKGVYSVDSVNKKILVHVEGVLQEKELCLEILTPFLEVIQVGALDAGEYQVQVSSDAEIKGRLAIREATSDRQDDFIYAPVDTAELTKTTSLTGSSQQLTLKGRYPYMLTGCMRITDVKSFSYPNDVLVVQPIVSILDESDCKAQDVDNYNRFTMTKDVSSGITSQGMVHIRTLSGRPLNKLVDFRTVQ